MINSLRALSVPLFTYHKNISKKGQNQEEKTHVMSQLRKIGNLANLSMKKQLFQKQDNTAMRYESKAEKKLKNFTKNEQLSESYVKEFKNLHKSSFILNNRLTKSVFDITDAATFGNPQPLNTFRSQKITNSSSNTIPSLKSAVRKFTKNQPKYQLTETKSFIPRRYQKSLSLGNLSLNKKNDLINMSEQKNKSFFPTTAVTSSQDFIKTSLKKKKSQKQCEGISTQLKFQLLYKQKTQRIQRLAKPISQRKATRIDHKISELKIHNDSMHKLIPIPKTKPQIIVAKGKGQIVPQDKILRVIDKFLSIIELYFQMYEQSGKRVMAYIKNVEGYQNDKIRQIISKKDEILRLKSPEELKQYFWIFKSLKCPNLSSQKQSVEKLPQFFGQEDYALYKILNNFVLKLETKYQNDHKQKFKTHNKYDIQISKRQQNNQKFKLKSIHGISTQDSGERKSFRLNLKFNPSNNDKKVSSQIQELEDLGVKFDFKQKGRSIILSDRSKIIFSKR